MVLDYCKYDMQHGIIHRKWVRSCDDHEMRESRLENLRVYRPNHRYDIVDNI